MPFIHTRSWKWGFHNMGPIQIFGEIRVVLKPKGLEYFSVRNHNDQLYGAEVKVEEEDDWKEEDINDINGFEARFFSEKEILIDWKKKF